MLNRRSDRANSAEIEIKKLSDDTATSVETIECDLQDFESVKNACSSIKEKHDAIDVLCNNAGVMALEDMATKDGYDIQMQTNHLSHFLLTKELFPLLQNAASTKGEARIVNHSSMARAGKPLEEKYFKKQEGGNLGGDGPSGKWERYHQTKLANIVYTLALADRLKDNTNIKAVCAAPGYSITN